MAIDRLSRASLRPLARLAWVIPTLLAIAIVETTRFTGIVLPVPFFIIIVCVVIAGSQGGQRSGIVAGIVASLFLVLAYFQQFGPVTLTGGVMPVALGSMLFVGLGAHLGRLRDQRDANIRSLSRNEKILKEELRKETAEKDAQAAVTAKSEAQLKTAIRIAGIGHFRFDSNSGNCEYCSDRHAAHFGLTPDEFQTQTAGSDPELFYIHSDDRHIVEDAIAQIKRGETQVFEYRGLGASGEIRYIHEIVEPVLDENGVVTKEVGTSIDLTSLREAEARVRQSQRIEAIGTLTGGVAHDFNNLLSVILGNLELSLESDDEADRRELVQTSIKATLRGASLTKNLLSFARRAHLEPTRLNLNQTIQDTMAWSARVLPETIKIEYSLMAGLWEVELDATSIENALINVLLNARDAMPDGGNVTIETANMRIDDEYVSGRHEDIEPGRYVMLAISDTGEGIAADKLDLIFEPFFTEKPVGKGSGLGLSMVQGFIKQSGGMIRVYSEVGVGTTFKLYFKAAEQKAEMPRIPLRDVSCSPSGNIEILVAEDEVDVVRMLKRVLDGAEYSVTTAGSGDEALEIFEAGGRYDLLLTDVVMPGKLQGPALAEAIRSIDPNIPCIFLSGYASEATVHGIGLKASDIRLMKPVSRSDLLAAISKALGSAGAIE